MKRQIVQRALVLVEQRPAPDIVSVLATDTPMDTSIYQSMAGHQTVTGYLWRWKTQGGYVAISVRINPEQRVKQNKVVTLRVTRDNVSILGSDAGTYLTAKDGNVSNTNTYELSFLADTQSELLSPINGLDTLLRSVLRVPVAR